MDRVQLLWDRQALADLVYRYCRAMDRRDWALMAALYHPDATHDHGAMFSGTGAEFKEWVKQAPASMMTHHFVGNCLFEVAGDRAEGEIYTINSHVIAAPDGTRQDYIAGGRYLDRYIRDGDGWQFLHRKRVIDWTYEGPTAAEVMARGLVRGTTDRSDPSFATLPLLAQGGAEGSG